jgi:DNA-binding XRE family transcriptional regulator
MDKDWPAKIRSIRKFFHATQEAMAGWLKVSKSTVKNLEAGRAAPSSMVSLKLALLAPDDGQKNFFFDLAGFNREDIERFFFPIYEAAWQEQRFRDKKKRGRLPRSNIDAKLRRGIRDSVRNSGKTFKQVAEEVSSMTNSNVTETMLKTWANEFGPRYPEFPVDLVSAFCHATKDMTLVQLSLESLISLDAQYPNPRWTAAQRTIYDVTVVLTKGSPENLSFLRAVLKDLMERIELQEKVSGHPRKPIKELLASEIHAMFADDKQPAPEIKAGRKSRPQKPQAKS